MIRPSTRAIRQIGTPNRLRWRRPPSHACLLEGGRAGVAPPHISVSREPGSPHQGCSVGNGAALRQLGTVSDRLRAPTRRKRRGRSPHAIGREPTQRLRSSGPRRPTPADSGLGSTWRSRPTGRRVSSGRCRLAAGRTGCGAPASIRFTQRSASSAPKPPDRPPIEPRRPTGGLDFSRFFRLTMIRVA